MNALRPHYEIWMDQARFMLDTLLQATRDVVAFKDRDGVFLACSDAYCELHSKPREHIIGKTDFDLWQPDDARCLRDVDLRALATGRPAALRRVLKTPTGERWIEATSRPWPDRTDECAGVLVAARILGDAVTPELPSVPIDLQTYLEYTPDPVILKNRELVVVAASDAYCRLHGKSLDEIVGKTDFDLYPAEQAREFEAEDRKALETGQVVTATHCLKTNPGERWYEAVKTPWRDATGATIGLLCNERDVSQYRTAQDAWAHFYRGVSALYETSLDINLQRSVPALLRSIVERATSLIGVPIGGVYVLRDDDETLELAAGHGLPPKYEGATVCRGQGIAGQVVQTGRTMNVADYQEWNNRAPDFDDAPFRRVLSVPIKVGQNVIGVICLTDLEQAGAFDEEQVRLANLFADQAAIAIRNARLNEAAQRELAERKRAEERLQRHLHDALLLNRLIATASSALEPAAVLQLVCDELGRSFGLARVDVALLDEDCTEMRIITEYGDESQPSMLGAVIPANSSPVQHVLEQRSALVVTDAPSDLRLVAGADEKSPSETVTLLIVPLMIRDRVIGAIWLNAAAPHEFAPEEITLADNVARAAGQALENAQLYAAVQQELEERKRAEAQMEHQALGMAALYQTSLQINTQKDLPQLLQAIVRRATELVDGQMGGLYLLRPDGKTLELAVSYNTPSDDAGAGLRLGEGLAERAIKAGRALVIDDYDSWEGHAAVHEGVPFSRVLAVPLRFGDRIIGVVNIDSSNRPERFDDDDIRLVSLFADQAAIAIENGRLYDASQREVAERRRIEEALRRERDFIANILDTADALVAVLDPRGWIMMFNRKCQQISGYTEHEVLGRVLWEFLIPPENLGEVREALTAAPSRRLPSYFENPWLTKDGHKVPVIWSNSIIWDAAGEPVYMIVTGLDASERVAHEQEIQQRNQELTVLYQVSRAAGALLDPVEVFRQVTTTLADVGQYPIVTAYAKVDGQFELCGAVGPVVEPQTGVWTGIHRRVMQTGQPQFVADVTQDPDYHCVSPEVTAEICVPVKLDGEIVGTLNVESGRARPLTESDLRLLLTIADQMSLLMRNALLHRNLKSERDHVNWINQQLLALQAVGTAVLSRLDIQELLNFIARSATELLGGQVGNIWLIGDDRSLTVHGSFAPDTDGISVDQHILSEQAVSAVAQQGQPFIVDDLSADPRFDQAAVSHEGCLSMISAPLFASNAVIGALNVYSTTNCGAFDPDDLQILSLLANQAAVAIEAAKLYAATAESEVRYRSLFEDNLDGIVLADAETGQILEANAAFQKMVGYSLRELRERRIFDLHAPRHQRAAYDAWMTHTARGIKRGRLAPYVTKDGGFVEAEFSMRIVDLGARRVEIASIRDVTETRRLEEQLRQSQKMEAIGTLASGIAHDFNNILGAVLGYASFVKSTLNPDDPRRPDIEVIENSARRGADLTSQLLAFGRGGPQEVKPISLNILVKEVLRLLSRTVDKSISMHAVLEDQLGTVEGDASQIQQLLLNLCINGCEAMPEGGSLTVETRRERLTKAEAQLTLGKPAGEYVRLTVTDTGHGMNEQTQGRIFEPFFSTKKAQPGKRHSGLGLATVFGIVRGHDGVIRVESTEGNGTTFRVWLPIGTGAADEEEGLPMPSEVRGGAETILVVDDEVPIRELIERVLSQAGYHVLAAADGATAIELMQTHLKQIDLVVLDMVMPGMSGLKAFQVMQELDPNVSVLVSTGYSDKGQAKEVLSKGAQGFMQKPFTLQDMLLKVRAILDERHN